MRFSWGRLDFLSICEIRYKRKGVNDNVLLDSQSHRNKQMTTKYKALDIARYFVWKSSQGGEEPISNLKLQKLIYYAQGLSLAMHDRPLFEDLILAWTYGPVVRSVYDVYKEKGASGIAPDPSYDSESIGKDTRAFLDEIYDAFGQFSAGRLMQLSHTDQCWIDAHPNRIISHKSMRDHLTKYLKNGKES